MARNLKNQGFTVFLDAWELIPGTDFTQTIYKALSQANKAILVATPDATESGWVQQEYSLMFSRQQQEPEFVFVPVVLGEFPDFPFLSNIQAVDFGTIAEAQYREAFHRLLCGLNRKVPGDRPSFQGPLELPELKREQSVDPQQDGIPFSQRVLDQFPVNRVPTLLQAQADVPSHRLAASLRAKAEQRYGPENCAHLYLPTNLKVRRSASSPPASRIRSTMSAIENLVVQRAGEYDLRQQHQ